MGLEIMEQVKDVDAVIIPVGGGGLIAGVSVAVKTLSPSTLVIVSHIELCIYQNYLCTEKYCPFLQGVESERCPSFTAAMKAGKPVKIDVNQAMTLADGK